MSPSLEQRIANLLLKRLDRLQRLDLLETASCVGLLDQVPLVQGEPEEGTKWIVTETAASLCTDEHVTRKLLASGYGRLLATRKRKSDYDQFSAEEGDSEDRPSGSHPGRNQNKAISSHEHMHHDVLQALIQRAAAPAPAALAVLLMMARGVAKRFPTMAELFDLFRSPAPSVLIRAPVSGFERHAGELLEEGCLLPFWCKSVDILERMPLTPDRSHRRAGKRRRVVHTASGRGLEGALTDRALQKLETALRGSASPFLIIDETSAPAQLPVLALADAVIECGALDHDLIARVMGLALSLPIDKVSAVIHNLEVASLALDDLNLAIKPGRTLDAALTALERLAAHRRKDTDSGEAEKDRRPKTTARDKANAADAKEAADVVVIQPVPLPAAENDRKALPLVETLAGYGKAKDWALDLKIDLALWREGQIPWSDLSSKLLLSGPPGTGKTLFATALCNSLQLPTIATSVANWLEPGYLGDVLKAMTDVFKAAEKHAPCILFIDELDNIGSRNKSGAGRHDDYWISLVNRLLVLLDGSLRTSGVVVIGATNRPEVIDPALLRSGRLEFHIPIDLPDISALTEIMKHHLGSDLASVLSTRPEATKATQKQEASARPVQLAGPPSTGRGNIIEQKGERA